MDTKQLVELVRTIHDHAHLDTDISLAIQIACSKLKFNPYQSREKSKAVQAVRRSRKNKHQKPPSNDFFWLALHAWAASDGSSLVILEGSQLSRERVEEIAIETTEFIESKAVSLIWALNVLPRPEDGEDPKGYSGQDIIAQLCLQLLQQNTMLHRQSALEVCLSRLKTATTEFEWFKVLAYFIEGLDEVYVVVDLDSMGRRNLGALCWPTAFKDMFQNIATKGIHSAVKAVFFTCEPVVTPYRDSSDVQVIRFPGQSTRFLHRDDRHRSQHFNHKSDTVNNSGLWLECVGRRKPKRARAASEDEDSDEGGDAMLANMSKRCRAFYSISFAVLVADPRIRRKKLSTWFDFFAQEFETCIDSSRKDEPSSRFPRVKIAVLDTGADLSHPDIADASRNGLVKYYDFVTNKSDMSDLDGHGTHCTSLLLKFAPNAEVYIGRVFRRSHAASSSLATLAKAINHATETWKVDIISISLGFTDSDTEVEQVISVAAAKCLLLASAANNTVHEKEPIRFPASMNQVFSIFSADGNGNPSTFNPRARYECPNFMFPGENILGAWPMDLAEGRPDVETRDGTTYRRLSGTSCATPIAAAVAAGLLEFAWQPREPSIDRVERLKRFDKMEGIFLEMVDKYKPGDGCYHYVLPWKLITTGKRKEQISAVLNYLLSRTRA